MRWASRVGLTLGVFVGAAGFAVWFTFRPVSWGSPAPIPQGHGFGSAPAFVGGPAEPRPLEGLAVQAHPFMAASNANSMHGNAQSSGTHAAGGPLGVNPEVRSRANAAFGGECATVTFDSRGRIVTVCASFQKFMLLLLDPDTLELLAQLDLPPRESNRSLNIRRIVTDTSGGAYFYLDHRDRAVLVDAENRLRVIGQREERGQLRFEEQASFALDPALLGHGRVGDKVTAVLPDWEGRYWFVSRLGVIGNVHPETGAISSLALEGEEIQNSLAIGPEAVYVVSDHALYRVERESGSDTPRIAWREPYDRGSGKKIGSVAQGSGTTPSLFGERYVAITDDADERVNLLVYERATDVEGSRLVCRLPLFEPGRSATDNSLIAAGRSLIAENNHGYDIFTTMMFGRTATGGVQRIDVEPHGRGCHRVWSSREISQTTVPKLSLSQGLVYLYTKDPEAALGVDAYYLTALDFETGETRFKIRTGTGVSYDNNWAPITLGDDGTAYVGTLRGLVMVRDRPSP